MAYGPVVLPGHGDRIATDLIDSVYVQRIKLAFGLEGSAVDVSGSNPLPITPAGNAVDDVTGAMNILPYSHHEIHEGDHYYIKTWMNITGAATEAYFMFTTPDVATRIHAKAAFSANAGFQVEIYKGGTVSDNGTPVVGHNNDHDSPNTPLLSPFAAPTVITDGTLKWDARVDAGKNANVSNETGYEILASRNEVYLFKITKEAAGENWIDINFWWYEHAPLA